MVSKVSSNAHETLGYLTATIRKYLTSMDLRVFGEKFSIIFEKVANVDFIVVLPGLVLGEEGGASGALGILRRRESDKPSFDGGDC